MVSLAGTIAYKIIQYNCIFKKSFNSV